MSLRGAAEAPLVQGQVPVTAESRPPAATTPRLLYVVSEDWYFLSHRLPMARAASNDGFEVHVATHVQDGGAAIKAEGFVLHPIPYARGRLSPNASLATIRALHHIHRTVLPAVTHHVSLQSAVLGTIAATGHSTVCVNALTGFGFSFASRTPKAVLARWMIRTAAAKLFNRKHIVNLVQNDDDRAALARLGIPPSRIAMIRGSGVDVAQLKPLPEPASPPTVAFVGRLLEDKGVRTLVAAQRLLRAEGFDVQLLIAGTPDPANPTSVSEAEAASWEMEPGITCLGHVTDIAQLWSRAHVAVLPSRREGLPLSLLEAAACGRAMVATDVPGCREIVVPNESGLLVPVDNERALAAAIARLISEPALRARLGAKARQMAVERFSTEIVGQQTVALYRSLLQPQTSSANRRDNGLRYLRLN